MELHQQVEARQELFLTPEIEQGIAILQMSAIDLSEYVRQCVEENPFLDDDDWEWPKHPYDADGYAKPVSIDALVGTYDAVKSGLSWESRVSSSQGEGFALDRYLSSSETLAEHLLEQLRVQPLTACQRAIGEYLIGNLDGNGYLEVTAEEAACALEVDRKTVEQVLALIQQFDPVGVASRSLAECLAVQLEERGQLEGAVRCLIGSNLEGIGQVSPVQTARELNITPHELDEAMDLLKTCNPRPGAQYGSSSNPVWPEIVVEKDADGRWEVGMQDFFLPHLRINAYYKTLAASEKNRDTTAYFKKMLDKAESLIGNIQYRKSTLYKIACCIVEMQMSFFEEGPGCLRALTMEQVAQMTELSESTVSRVSRGNYISTPHGVFELRFFFQAAAAEDGRSNASQAGVKYRIAKLIEGEDEARPLSDQEIADILERSGIAVSRRTVNKYRADMGIPAQKFRKRF